MPNVVTGSGSSVVWPDGVDEAHNCTDPHQSDREKTGEPMFGNVSCLEVEKVQVHSGRGISWFIASVIIVADMVGGGLVAMPAGFPDTGLLLGCIFMITIAIFFTTTAHLLAQTWGIMRDRWPTYKEHCRRPYPEIGLRSFGPRMRVFTAICVYITLFGTTTVYVILSSKIFHNFLSYYEVHIPFCLLLIILAIIIWPVTLLKSPADFWFVVAFALTCTIIAVVFILIGVRFDIDECWGKNDFQPPGVGSIFSLGTFIFAFSGHHVFPTVQHDMYEPKEFTKSVLLGYLMCCLLYMPVSIISYLVYGNSIRNSVIDSVQTDWIRHGSNLAMAFHCVLTIILTINPINQQLEDIFRVPHKMCFKRILVRTGLLAVVLFVALSVPNFGSIMDFFGSTTIPFTCVILPTLFGIWLKAQRYNDKTGQWEVPTIRQVFERTSRKQITWSIIVNVVTIICAIISAVMAVDAMATIRFVSPCYLQFFGPDKNLTTSVVNCCGVDRNLNKFNPQSCLNYINNSSYY